MNDDELEAIVARMQEGLAAGDCARDLWHDKHVDADMAALIAEVRRLRERAEDAYQDRLDRDLLD